MTLKKIWQCPKFVFAVKNATESDCIAENFGPNLKLRAKFRALPHG